MCDHRPPPHVSGGSPPARRQPLDERADDGEPPGHAAVSGAAPYRAGEDTPEDVIVIEELEEALLEQVGEGHLPVHHGDPQLDVRLFFISVNGQPLVSKEPGLLSSLDIVDDDVAEMPGLHLPDA